jgi:hypothetical protein
MTDDVRKKCGGLNGARKFCGQPIEEQLFTDGGNLARRLL